MSDDPLDILDAGDDEALGAVMIDRMTKADEIDGIDQMRPLLVEHAESIGRHDLAKVLREGTTPEQEAAFDEWLAEPGNRERWEAALSRRNDPGLLTAFDARVRRVFGDE